MLKENNCYIEKTYNGIWSNYRINGKDNNILQYMIYSYGFILAKNRKYNIIELLEEIKKVYNNSHIVELKRIIKEYNLT